MGVWVALDLWDSLSSLPPKVAMVALVSNAEAIFKNALLVMAEVVVAAAVVVAQAVNSLVYDMQ